uniref:ATP synthase 8 n=1 Tax=Proasellus arthrodilus TaxID=1281940 RepID=A0A485M7N3_9CRUS|nr:ATP synthase 8 [Proasellus arthrodilus]
MPQMAPMFWTLLMVLFTMAFLSFMVKLYFFPTKHPLYLVKENLINLKNQWPW